MRCLQHQGPGLALLSREGDPGSPEGRGRGFQGGSCSREGSEEEANLWQPDSRQHEVTSFEHHRLLSSCYSWTPGPCHGIQVNRWESVFRNVVSNQVIIQFSFKPRPNFGPFKGLLHKDDSDAREDIIFGTAPAPSKQKKTSKHTILQKKES